jgi:hypothetical protein
MLTIDDIRARECRLGELSRGLMKERAIIREAQDPLLYLAGVGTARLVLAKTLGRIDSQQPASVA